MTRLDDPTAVSSGPAPRSRFPRWALVAAAAAVLAVVGVSAVELGWLGGADPQAPPPAASGPASVTTLQAPAAARAGRCQVPTAAVLANATVAVDGRVTSLRGGQATLEVAHWYRGDPTDRVVVHAPSEDLQALIMAVRLEVDGRYLVAAQGDVLMVCGFSAPYTADSAALYAEAFGS
ncbi:MAG: hypothetical protein R2731_14015 [Nocardioides sp.]